MVVALKRPNARKIRQINGIAQVFYHQKKFFCKKSKENLTKNNFFLCFSIMSMLNFKLFLFLLEDKNDVMIFLSVSIQGFFYWCQNK
jgi:hypothetical protein